MIPWTEKLRRLGHVIYEADDWSERHGRINGRDDYNGALVYVEDEETGERDWIDRRRIK